MCMNRNTIPLPKAARCTPACRKYPLREVGETAKHGTRVIYLADAQVFDDIEVQFDRVSRRLRELAFLVKGVTIRLRDEREAQPRELTFCYMGGIVDFLTDMNQDKTPLHPAPIHFSGERNGILAEVAMQYVDSDKEYLYSYVNNISTGEGGTHETGFKVALTKVMNEYIETPYPPPSRKSSPSRARITAKV